MTAFPGRVGLLFLDRPHARGGQVRVQTWRSLLRATGMEVIEFPQRLRPRNVVRPASVRRVPGLFSASVAPETLFWRDGSFDARLREAKLDAVICVTARLWDASLPATRVIIDFVDDLGESYRSRARSENGALISRLGYQVLARSTERVSAVIQQDTRVRRVTASWSEQTKLNADWVPIIVPDDLISISGDKDHDAVFIGSLNYPPNVEALAFLHEIWPEVSRRRPGTRLLVAGARATAKVRHWALERNWTLLENFSSVACVAARARIAVAPLPYASGIQVKVLEAGALGLPQVVLPAALQGLEPGFPALVSSPESFVSDFLELLENEAEQKSLAMAATAVIDERYRLHAWTSFVTSLLS